MMRKMKQESAGPPRRDHRGSGAGQSYDAQCPLQDFRVEWKDRGPVPTAERRGDRFRGDRSALAMLSPHLESILVEAVRPDGEAKKELMQIPLVEKNHAR